MAGGHGAPVQSAQTWLVGKLHRTHIFALMQTPADASGRPTGLAGWCQLLAARLPGNVVVLAEHTAQVAAGEEDSGYQPGLRGADPTN
ncbi:hypothetical protein H7H69_07355 [Mycobacterium heckeshornense]|uniref:Uncharacterized protein n=1 Tax=Mycobacterium heckeshornense TaxID=110505 RepID=A0A2I3EKD5_9MYCO|nr:hypothetical protein [Mycobacterium heckeshornense]KMV21645.1 hypothetical protein ACT16_15675 [Mycobacterium heckeshornense]MCV7034044.1 hypothetical protein [Mycobacterium heckeshornense]BCO34821.1 hypothetical protein MHEC_12540 [Mycobacterium heckeshornense]